ncbi:MAG TPA: tetratricopeptide repeat protein [Cellvibrio sp.]|nr:tetratricopeptide repeat protein [Cellvibrio sp.]
MRQIDLVKLYGSKRCLVVDDMPDVRVSISGMLRVFGVKHVDVVANGDQAIEACNNTDYNLVLCDYNLGDGRDGQQILEELRYRNRLKNTSIFVMITAESSRDMVLGALECQPDDYVTKPFTQVLLRERLDRVVLRHEELMPIKQGLDEKNYPLVEKRCQELLNENTRYRNTCLQYQAEMNFRMGELQRAEDIYTGVLAERPVLWAKLGLGKTQIAKKEYESAEKILVEVIATDRRVVEAHDLLADSYLAQGDSERAQKAMQNAAEVSPKSVMRQRRLATLAKSNNDTEVCLEASRRVIKTARNSCYETADDYFNLARELSDSTANGENAEKHSKELFEVLQRLEKRPYFDVNANIQTNTLKSRTLFNQNQKVEAEGYLRKATALYEKKQNEVDSEAAMGIAEMLMASGDKKAADSLLHQLVEKFPDNAALQTKADAMSDTPKSKEGHKKVADMTRTGVGLYENGFYSEAIKVFEGALAIFSGHIGLNLNLVQCVVADMKKNGDKKGYGDICRAALQRISHVTEDNPQYARYQYLLKQVDELF